MKKTSNAQRQTPNLEWNGRVAETLNGEYQSRPKRASLTEVEELIRIFAASVRTTEKNAK
jgi:hypothetical protein